MSVSARATGVPNAVFRFGEYTLDMKSHLLLRNGARQHLSPKAAQLLELLLMAWPGTRSRQEIYDELWPSTFVCETNMAGVVSELRRVLGDDARASQYIRTVHGFGYAFCGDVVVAPPQSCARATLHCEGQVYPLCEGANTVGRSPDCRIVLANHAVSRHHAVITVEKESIRLDDLGSKNGTFVDARRIESAPLTTRSRIVFGAVAASILSGRPTSTASMRLGPNEVKRLIAPETAGM